MVVAGDARPLVIKMSLREKTRESEATIILKARGGEPDQKVTDHLPVIFATLDYSYSTETISQARIAHCREQYSEFYNHSADPKTASRGSLRADC